MLVNRRVRMTKKMMKDAMLELMESRPLEKISVTDLCENADLNRSTFYAYYEDVGQLLAEIENDVLNQLPVAPDKIEDYSNDTFLSILETFFEYVRENERLFRILIIKRDSNSFHSKLLNTVMEKYRDLSNKNSILPSRYKYLFCLRGVMGIMKEWIIEGFPFSSREFSRIALQMCTNVIK